MTTTQYISARSQWTEEQLMALPDIGHKVELVDGRLVMAPAGFEHGDIGMLIGSALSAYVRAKRLGRVVDSSTGFWMKTENMRSPDVAFIAASRFKGMKRLPKGFFRGSPDLAVEILSPSDTVETMHGRIEEYFLNGTRLAWLVNPDEQTVLVYHDSTPDTLLKMGDALSGEDVVPGFSLPLAEIFDEINFD